MAPAGLGAPGSLPTLSVAQLGCTVSTLLLGAWEGPGALASVWVCWPWSAHSFECPDVKDKYKLKIRGLILWVEIKGKISLLSLFLTEFTLETLPL